MKDVADKMFNYLGDIIYDPAKAKLDVEQLPEDFQELGAGLHLFAEYVLETKELAKSLSKGQLNVELPDQENHIAGPLKALHSSLKHLTWQAQQIAGGDYKQHVDYMGELGVAFNTMAEALEEYRTLGVEERSKLQQYVKLLMANTPNVVLVFDTEGRNVLVSEAYLKKTKTPSFEDVRGKSFADLFSEISTDEFMRTMNKAIRKVLNKKKSTVYEQELDFSREGNPLIYVIRIVPMLLDDGRVAGTIIILEDITEITRARQEAEEARRLAEDASRVKSEFLALMSHEIRTPINAIMGMTEIALRSQAIDEIHGNLNSVKHASDTLLTIINDILDISKIESGRMEIVPDEYSFLSFVHDVASTINTRLCEKPILFTTNISPDIPRNMIGDYARVRQIVLNLLGNSVKYTEEGFVSVTVDCDIEDDNVLLKIEVSDSGAGMKEEYIDTIFEKYCRLDSHKNKSIQGTGLGLPITKMLCEAMGGTISVQSEYGVGSTFTVTIPQKIKEYKKLAEVENPDQKTVLLYEPRQVYANSLCSTFRTLGVECTHVTSGDVFWDTLAEKRHPYVFVSSFLYKSDNKIKKLAKKPEMKSKMIIISEHDETDFPGNILYVARPVFSLPIANALNNTIETVTDEHDNSYTFVAPEAKILIVDDISINLAVAEGLMLPYEMQIETCTSGFEAIKLVKENKYDIVFMDHAMPEMDGIETTIKIRSLEDADGYYQNVPIIALTANAVSGMREIYLQNGMNDFISKPINVKRLNSMLKKWIPKEKQQESEEHAMVGADDSINIRIENVDTKLGLSLNGGILKNYIKTMTIFCASVPEKARELEASLEENNVELYTTIVHGLKNAAMNIGAQKISDMAKSLEKAGRSEKVKFIKEYNGAFLSDLDKLVQNVRWALEVLEHEDDIDLKPADAEFLKESLHTVKEALSGMETTKAKNVIKELEAMVWNKEIYDLLSELRQSILMYEYDEAVEMIEDFAEAS